jgi:hypothetical protein
MPTLPRPPRPNLGDRGFSLAASVGGLVYVPEKLCPFSTILFRSHFVERSYGRRGSVPNSERSVLNLNFGAISNCKNITVVKYCFHTVAEMTNPVKLASNSRFGQTRDCAAQESPGDRVPVSRGFRLQRSGSRGTHVFHHNLYFPSRDYWRRLGRPDCCCRIRVLQPLPRIFR